jgi:hypothetical protein
MKRGYPFVEIIHRPQENLVLSDKEARQIREFYDQMYDAMTELLDLRPLVAKMILRGIPLSNLLLRIREKQSPIFAAERVLFEAMEQRWKD